QVLDGSGVQLPIGITAQGLSPSSPFRAGRLNFTATATGTGPHPYAGLWVGYVVVQRISRPSDPQQPDTPLPVANALRYRVLVHVDAQGQARLLQRVLQMWKQGTLKADPDGSGFQVVDQPGRFVLVTDDRFI